MEDSMTVLVDDIETPIGNILVAAQHETIVAIEMGAARDRTAMKSRDVPGMERRFRERLARRFGGARTALAPRSSSVRRAIERYFEGDVDALDALDVDPGGADFDARVWALLRTIPAGHTMTYGEVAARAGSPGAARAAGRAVGSNPIPIVIPCHRVVGKNGSLTGFGGGLSRKLWLLEHEGAILV
jgi:methylated-DNA-[protein]-cysteine S-methyltransferase